MAALSCLVALACTRGPLERATDPRDASGAAGSGGPRCPDGPLLQEVRRQGRIRVIATLAVEGESAAGPRSPDSPERRRRIAAAQDRVIGELAGTAAEVVRRSSRFPTLALRVDEAALCRLLASSHVRSVQPDGATPPAGGP